ncbi:MAG: Xaa-Pro peptidase family protein [Gammaproteobacteria bacterium]|nr:Xaa-Pro peptidase family protein [Gammaproteobacteria bacterium]MDH4314994.1 Xaa-Pro peptidase family protein [Gammaproteobacteria bacterium]MDH5215522.1 Xaa-Pro peptidase family protein [Gammaproteobacteria bacterium]MDH5499922.1 Xaa-Pro peptidase family protein [Gammaproteobacteria bacterium]
MTFRLILIALSITVVPGVQPAADPVRAPSHGFSYDYAVEAALAAKIDVRRPDPRELRAIFAKRRARVIESIPDGAMLLFSVDRAQERRLEFQVPHSDNHDFIYLTGLDGLDSLNSALLLVPASNGAAGRLDEAPRDRVALFTSADPIAVAKRTGIADVRPFAELERELSVAMTDFRDWRITQVRRWPLAAALSRSWGENEKVLYLNYPRFFRLGEAEPSRLDTFARIQRFSPEMKILDSADILDRVRMLHDSWSLANLRRAVEITGDGVVEALRAARAGMTESEVMEIMDFVYRYHGATLGFPTSVRRQPATGAEEGPAIPEGWIEFVPRSGGAILRPGDMVWTDTGAAFNHYSADIQRNAPVDGTFTDEQRRLYSIALNVQKTVIGMVRPGVTWWELHDKAIAMLRDAGGYDEDYYYGIGHFIGMEVHDEGDYLIPLQAGMVLSIEQGVMKPGEARIAFEDDVLVTEDGYEWLSRSIPIEVDEIEQMMKTPSAFRGFVENRANSLQ